MVQTHDTTCSQCGAPITLRVQIDAEQAGGPETEYLPMSIELEDTDPCATCGHVITKTEAAQLVDALHRVLTW